MRKCEIEGCEYPVFGKNRCKNHYPKTAIKKITKRGIGKKEERKKKNKELIQFYLDLWDKRSDKNGNVKCFESDTLLSHTVFKNNICCYNHYLSKSKYPQYALEEWNIEIVHPNEHSQWEANPKLCPKMYRKYKKLKEKYANR